MKKVILSKEDSSVIDAREVKLNQAVFVKDGEKYVGMVILDDDGMLVVHYGGGGVKSRTRYSDLAECVKGLKAQGINCYVDDSE